MVWSLRRPLASPSAAALLGDAVDGHWRGDARRYARAVAQLAERWPDDVAGDVVARLEWEVGLVWDRGWEPADLNRMITKELGHDAARLTRAAIAAEARGYAELGDRVAPAWMSQLDVLGARPGAIDLESVLSSVSRSWRDTVALAVDLVVTFRRLPPIPELMDPPSAWVEGGAPVSTEVPGVLLRIRALLAKAESTTFDAEAEAFTAKAQELMIRHRIDRVALPGSGEVEDEQVLARRIGVDDPYPDAKASLLAGIAEANGARAVWTRALWSSTVFGYPIELHVIEELYTSLLAQAVAALRREGSKRDAHGRSRTQNFRRSFLTAYASRITDRLMETVEEIVEEAIAQTGTDLVPILVAREEAAEEALAGTFPNLARYAPSVTDPEGVHAGRLAADQADLSAGPPLDRTA